MRVIQMKLPAINTTKNFHRKHLFLIALSLALFATGFTIKTSADTSCTTTVTTSAQAVSAVSSASGGAVICLANGSTFGSMDLTGTHTSMVTVRPASAGSVTINGLGFQNASNIEVDNVTTGGWAVQDSQHIIMRHVKSGNVGLPGNPGGYIANVQDLKVYDSEIGPQNPRDGLQIWPSPNGQNKDILFDNFYMHDLSRSLDPAEHTDCVQLASGENVTFTRSRFYNCATQGFYPGGDFGGGVVKNVTLENSWIGDAQEGYYGLQITGPLTGITIRNNTITGGVNLNPGLADVHIIGNFFAESWSGFDYSCQVIASRATEFKYNLINASSCSGADATNHVSLGVRDSLVNPDATTASQYDLHLKSGSSAIDMPGFTLATGCAAVDYDGGTRPVGASCDAGAHEYGSVAAGGGGGGTPPATYHAADLTSLISHYGKASGAVIADGDINGDGAVNIYDISKMLTDYSP